MLHRDLSAERSAQQTLRMFGLAGNASGQFHLTTMAPGGSSAWLPWADDDFAVFREAGFAVSVDAGLKDWIRRADALEVQMAPQGSVGADDDLLGGDDSRSPWFDLSLGMAIDGQRHNILPMLPELLAQLGVASHKRGAALADDA